MKMSELDKRVNKHIKLICFYCERSVKDSDKNNEGYCKGCGVAIAISKIKKDKKI